MATTSGFASRSRDLIRLAGFRYRGINLPFFIIGCVAGGGAYGLYLALGLAAIMVASVNFMLANRLADRVEDFIDYSERKRIFEELGERTIRYIMLAVVPVYLALVTLMTVAVDLSPGTVVLWIAYLLGALGYSYGPRLKQRSFGGPLLLAVHGPALFLLGYGGLGGTWDASVGSALAILLLAPASCAFAKDAPNMEGDEAIGYQSLYRRMIGHVNRTRAALSIPHVLTLVLLATGVVGASFVAVLVMIPMAEVLARTMARASTLVEREVVREVAFIYLLCMMTGALFGFHPALVTVLVGAGGIAWYVGFTKWMHTEPGLMTWSRVRVAARMVAGGSGS